MKTINKDTAKKHIYKTNGKFFSAVFIKKNGEERFIHCMTRSKKGVKGVGLSYNPDERNNVIVKDLKIHEFRTINIDTLVQLTTGGVKYNVEEDK